MHTELIEGVIHIARRAGAAIMALYRAADVHVQHKGDASPVTAADRAAHRIIAEGLHRLTAQIPVLSEEGQDIAYTERAAWTRFWLVDPLDGTKEFIKRNGEFTVNIALIDTGRPVLGVVYAPALDTLYVGEPGKGAWKQHDAGPRQPLRVCPPEPGQGHRVVQSRSHPSGALADYLRTLRVAQAVPVGSALKFCALAEGRATLYPRFGPTMEWDTAAGQAVVEAAGGKVVQADDPARPLQYNKPELVNGPFIASA